jgi:hypothetical protein
MTNKRSKEPAPFDRNRPLTCANRVDLIGRYSNHLTLLRELERVCRDLGKAVADPVEVLVSVCSDRVPGREPRAVVDRLGESGVEVLVDRFVGGATARELAAEWGVSLSSVKRILRGRGVRRRGGVGVLA